MNTLSMNTLNMNTLNMNTLNVNTLSMNTLTLPTLDNQLNALELELAQLAEKVAQKKALRKAIAEKKKQAVRVVTKLEKALSQMSAAFTELGESAEELKTIAVAKINEYFPQPKEQESKLISFPKKQNQSNELFTWQKTANPQLACYFDVAKKVNTATYIGGNNKKRLESVGTNLTSVLPGISFEIRKAQRLDYKYELKIKGLDDSVIGWLVQFDFNRDFSPQFCCRLKAESPATQLKLTEHNWIAAPGAAIVNNLFPYNCHLIELDDFGMGIAKDKVGNKFDIYLDDWHLVIDFEREAQFVYQAIKGCKTQKELEMVKNSNQIKPDFLKFVWHNMPQEDKKRIENMVSKTA